MNRPSFRFGYPLLLLAVCLTVMLPYLGATRLWDQDEGYFAGAAAEMYARGDWIVPYFNGEMFGHKPPWMYWMMMLGFEAFGVNEFAARIGAAIFGAGAALLTYELGRRLFTPRAGLLAGLAMATCVMFHIVSRAATPDSFLVFFSTLALLIFVAHGVQRHAASERGGARDDPPADSFAGPTASELLPQRWHSFALIYAAMGFGVLAKGPIGVLLPMAVIGMFLLCMSPRRELPSTASRWQRIREAARPFGPVNFIKTVWKMRPLTAITMVVLVAGPWYLAVGIATDGEFLREFIGVHHLQRFSTPMDNHRGPIFYYLPAVLVGMFPWSVFAIPTAIFAMGNLRGPRSRVAMAFLLSWAGVYIGLFSLASTKLPSYVLPAYPALAVMCGALLDRWLCDRTEVPVGWIRTGLIVLAGVGLVMIVALPLAGSVAVAGQTLLERAKLAREVHADLVGLALLGIPLLVGGTLAWALSWRAKAEWAVGTFVLTAIAIPLGFWSYTVARVDRFQTTQELAIHIVEDDARAERRIAQYGYFQPSMVFYSGRRIEACDATEAHEFFARHPHGLLITTEARYRQLAPHWPSDVTVLQRRHGFPKNSDLLLWGRATALDGAAGKITLGTAYQPDALARDAPATTRR